MENKLLDIDYLKANNQRLYYFGLGFIQLVLNKNERIHFYNRELTVTNEEIHNHRYNFTSYILKGTFLNTKYQLIKGDDYILKNESCNKNIKVNDININVSVKKEETKIYTLNDSYDMFYNEFHTVAAVDNTITYLNRGDIIMDNAQVLYPKNSNVVCPFETKISDNDLWDLIYNTIKY